MITPGEEEMAEKVVKVGVPSRERSPQTEGDLARVGGHGPPFPVNPNL